MHVPRLLAPVIGALPVLTLLFLPLAAAGAPSVLHDMVERAWLRAPAARGVSARQAEVDAARDLAGAWVAGQPVLGLSQRNGRSHAADGLRESEVSMSAPVWTPGQRNARRSLAEQSAAKLDAHARKTRLDVAGEVRMRLWDAAAARALLDEREGHLHHIEDLTEEVRLRVAAGELARVDALLAEQEVYAARIAVQQAKAEVLATLAKLQILTGPLAVLPTEPEPLAPEAAATDPRLLAARATESRAQAALQLAQASRSAPPTIGLSLRRERDSPLAAPERSLGLSLQVPLGSAGRNRPAETQVQTQIAVAAAEARQTEDTVREELALARLQLDNARAMRATARARAAAMREHHQLIDKAFKLGERGLADLLRSRALSHEADVAERQQEVALGRAHAQFNQASGVLP